MFLGEINDEEDFNADDLIEKINEIDEDDDVIGDDNTVLEKTEDDIVDRAFKTNVNLNVNYCHFRFHKFDQIIDTTRVDEIPAKEPKLNAVPLKSALKKPYTDSSFQNSPQQTPTQESVSFAPQGDQNT